MMVPNVHGLYDENTATVTYVVWDPGTMDGIIIDPVLDYDPNSSTVSKESNYKLNKFIMDQKVKIHYILETHAHADHLSGAQDLKLVYPHAHVAIGRRIIEVQDVFKKIYNLPEQFIPNGSQFDVLLDDGARVKAGSLEFLVIATPGHTPACCSYLIGDAVFTGDALFMPDTGTGRCDFPRGSARDLYASVHDRLYQLPDATRVFTAHDYKASNTREARWETTIGESKQKNIQIKEDTKSEEYITMRESRDKTLVAPRLLLPSIQINIDGGRLPQPENNGVSYLKLPIKQR